MRASGLDGHGGERVIVGGEGGGARTTIGTAKAEQPTTTAHRQARLKLRREERGNGRKRDERTATREEKAVDRKEEGGGDGHGRYGQK